MLLVYNQNANPIAWNSARPAPVALSPGPVRRLTADGRPFADGDLGTVGEYEGRCDRRAQHAKTARAFDRGGLPGDLQERRLWRALRAHRGAVSAYHLRAGVRSVFTSGERRLGS